MHVIPVPCSLQAVSFSLSPPQTERPSPPRRQCRSWILRPSLSRNPSSTEKSMWAGEIVLWGGYFSEGMGWSASHTSAAEGELCQCLFDLRNWKRLFPCVSHLHCFCPAPSLLHLQWCHPASLFCLLYPRQLVLWPQLHWLPSVPQHLLFLLHLRGSPVSTSGRRAHQSEWAMGERSWTGQFSVTLYSAREALFAESGLRHPHTTR